MFISSNRASFHLWWKENLVKHQKVSKYIKNGCRDGSFYPISSKRFDHLETLLTVRRPKKVSSAVSMCRPLVLSPQSKCTKKTLILLQKYHFSVTFHRNWKLTCISGAKPGTLRVKDFILPHKYHAQNFYRTSFRTLAK